MGSVNIGASVQQNGHLETDWWLERKDAALALGLSCKGPSPGGLRVLLEVASVATNTQFKVKDCRPHQGPGL